MDDNQELLLTDSLSGSPRNTHQCPQQQEILLGHCDKTQLQTSDITIILPVKSPSIFQQVNFRLRGQQQLQLCFLQDQESSQQDQLGSKMSVQKIEKAVENQNKKYYSFNYQNLTAKLEIALQRIKNKMKSNIESRCLALTEKKSLFSSRIMRLSSPKEYRKNLNKEQGYFTDRKKSNSMMKTCITEPDQKETFAQIFYRYNNAEKYKTDRIINEQVQKENPSSLKTRRGEPLRTKKEFLASMAYWQEQKVKKQQERIEKEKELLMAGVTFTPQINARSKELMKKKGHILPIYERQIHHVKPQKEHSSKNTLSSKGKK